MKWWYRKDGGAEALAWQRGGKSGRTAAASGGARGGQLSSNSEWSKIRGHHKRQSLKYKFTCKLKHFPAFRWWKREKKSLVRRRPYWMRRVN